MNSQKYLNVMHFPVLVFINLLLYANGKNITDSSENVSVNKILEGLLSIIDIKPNERITELNGKLANLSKYVIHNEKVNKLLINITKETNLNETNFFRSLNEDDHYRFLIKDDPKSLYLKLKEKVTRDDVMNILNETNHADAVVKSARKAMGQGYHGKSEKEIIDDVVDKLIAEVPNDVHNYKASVNDSKYWDPQRELSDLHDHHQHDGRRLYRGERTTIRYYPFMASVHVMGRFWCGGVIYWHDLVLTSASCLQLMHNNRFFRENPKILEVRIGSNHSRIGGETIDALEVYFHPSYSPKSLRNNIALIRLRRRLYFNYHRLPKIIDISHNDGGLPDTAEVLLLGWGVTKMSQKMSYEPIFLQRKFLPVYPNKFCKEVYGDKFITSTMFCAGTLTTGEGACDHDAGGPAILAGKLVGIISFGPTVCGYPNTPTVFTLVGAFADWIETINETMPSYYRARKRTTTTTPSPLLDLLQRWPKGLQRLESLAQLTRSPLYNSDRARMPLYTSDKVFARMPLYTSDKVVARSPLYTSDKVAGLTTEAKVRTHRLKSRDDESREGWSIGG